jgi:hypothetical protein
MSSRDEFGWSIAIWDLVLRVRRCSVSPFLRHYVPKKNPKLSGVLDSFFLRIFSNFEILRCFFSPFLSHSVAKIHPKVIGILVLFSQKFFKI